MKMGEAAAQVALGAREGEACDHQYIGYIYRIAEGKDNFIASRQHFHHLAFRNLSNGNFSLYLQLGLSIYVLLPGKSYLWLQRVH